MESTTFTFKDHDGIEIFVYKWMPDSGDAKACIQIVHGLAEHAGRYAKFAEYFTNAGYICYADDHRGHGKTACTEENRGKLGLGGWESVIKDLKQLNDTIKDENPGKPVFLIGHSWGSLLLQDYIQQFGKDIKGVVLSGASGAQPFIVQKLGPFLTKQQIKKHGADTPSDFSYNLTFKAYNKKFLPSPTGTDFDWINRNAEAVKDYVADPWCGWKMTGGMALEMVLGLIKMWKPENERKIPVNLPVLVMSGTDDSTNMSLKNLKPLVNRYKNKYGIKDVMTKYYEGARHEIFNETNKDEVLKDLLTWLDAHLPQ